MRPLARRPFVTSPFHCRRSFARVTHEPNRPPRPTPPETRWTDRALPKPVISSATDTGAIHCFPKSRCRLELTRAREPARPALSGVKLQDRARQAAEAAGDMNGELDSGNEEAPSAAREPVRPREQASARPCSPRAENNRHVNRAERPSLSVSGFLTFVLPRGARDRRGARMAADGSAKSRAAGGRQSRPDHARRRRRQHRRSTRARWGHRESAMWFNILTLLDGNRGALKRGEYEFKGRHQHERDRE